MPTSGFYHFGFDNRMNSTAFSKTLDLIKKTASTHNEHSLEKFDLHEFEPLRFPDFVSIKDIVESSSSGFDGVFLKASHRTISNKNGADENEPNETNDGNITNNATQTTTSAENQADPEFSISGDYELKYYRDLYTFNETSSDVQKCLVLALENLPGYVVSSNILTEHLLQYIIGDLIPKIEFSLKNSEDRGAKVNQGFTWTFIMSDFLDRKAVFVQFEDILTLKMFKDLVQGLHYTIDTEEHKLEVGTEPVALLACEKLEEHISFSKEEAHLSTLQKSLKERMSLLAKTQVRSGKKSDRLDNLSRYYDQYEVDASELQDVPSEMLDSVKENIIEFRLRVSKLESQKKEQQSMNDKRNSRLKLKKLFHDLQRTDRKTSSANDPMDLDNDSDDDEDDENNDNSVEAMTDDDYYKQEQAQQKAKNEKLFLYRQQQVRKSDSIRAQKYDAFTTTIDSAAYVEQYIPTSKKRFLETFVNGISDSNNKIDTNLNYYVNHGNYLAYRNKARLEEERLDDLDRQEQQKEDAINEEKNDFLSSYESTKTPVKLSLKKKEDFQSTATLPASTHTGSLDSSVLDQVKSKIEAVVEEYLGMKEDSLMSFIFSFVETNYYKGTSSPEYEGFIKELAETLDEDAPVAAEEVYSYIATLVK